MKKCKKILSMLIIAIMMIGRICNIAYAAELQTRLTAIKMASDPKNLEDNQGTITKTITEIKEETGEVTIKVQVNNKSPELDDTEQVYENTEIFIIIPEYTNANENEKLTYIENLASKVLEKNSNTKIGVIGVQGPIADITFDEDGKQIKGENDESEVNGTADNAEIIVDLTDDLTTFKSNLRSMNSEKKAYYDNVQAAVRLGKNSFSNNVNKILISVYDAVPITTIGTKNKFYYGLLYEYDTPKEAGMAHLEKIVANTKSEFLSLQNSNIDFILLRPDDTGFDLKFYNTNTGELNAEIDGKPYADALYGTLENPTYGKMYSLNNASLETIVTEYIYNDIMQSIQQTMKDVVIKDYFPDEIVDNFDIIISSQNTENVDTANLLTDNYITWDIGTLDGNKTATLEYTLKIKDMKNAELLNRIVATNEKVEIEYTNYEEKQKIATMTSSPTISLTEIKEELTATVSYDPIESTTGKVIATIKTNKPVKPVEGWEISSDGKTLTKTYTKNTTETVTLVDMDEMAIEVTVKITNIITEQEKSTTPDKDTTTSQVKIPNAGLTFKVIAIVLSILLVAVILYSKYSKYKEI